MGKILYHATTPKKLEKYRSTGAILPPVRGWISEQCARMWMKKVVGRTILLRVEVQESFPLPDHQPRGCAYWSPDIVREWEEIHEKTQVSET